MRAIILAAGRGRRMQNLTDQIPKALLSVRGKPLIDSALETLGLAGIDEVAIVTGYKANLVQRLAIVRSFHNERWESTQMVYSLWLAKEWLSQAPTIVCYSDILFSEVTIQKLVEAPGEIVVSNNVNWQEVWSKRFADPLLDAETFKRNKDGFLTEIGKKPNSLNEIQGQYMGLIKFTPSGWKSFENFLDGLPVERLKKIDMTSALNDSLNNGVRVGTVDIAEPWFEFDSQEDLESYT